MALPPQHPFWAALLVTLAVAAFSAVLVYARADRIVSESTAAAFDRKRLRRIASAGIAGSALLFGAVVSGLFVAMQTQAPELAVGLYRWASAGAASLLSLAAVRMRAGANMRGVPELIALNLLWAAGFGWALPAVARGPIDGNPPILIESMRGGAGETPTGPARVMLRAKA
jgi:hypothetical protein